MQAKIRIDYADKSEQRKIMPLCHQLRADDDVCIALRNPFKLGLQRPRAAVHIGTERCDPRVRKQRSCFLAQTLHTRPDRGKSILGTAGRADCRYRFAFATLMADQTFQKPVFDHARITLIAANLMTARPTQGDRRVAAPVDKQQRLLAFFNSVLHRLLQGR